MGNYEIPDAIDVSVVQEAQVTYNVSKQGMAKLLGISNKTYYNLMKTTTLDKNQSDRFTYIQNILKEGASTFNGSDNFREWLHTEQPTLSGAKPLDMLATITGAHEVLVAVSRIKHGIFA
ncbi:MAG: DUF2384 domain-containing protein [Cytophagales bacterium]|nr:DUF2384 domain-containing protein [Cytophagales bacterium]